MSIELGCKRCGAWCPNSSVYCNDCGLLVATKGSARDEEIARLRERVATLERKLVGHRAISANETCKRNDDEDRLHKRLDKAERERDEAQTDAAKWRELQAEAAGNGESVRAHLIRLAYEERDEARQAKHNVVAEVTNLRRERNAAQEWADEWQTLAVKRERERDEARKAMILRCPTCEIFTNHWLHVEVDFLKRYCEKCGSFNWQKVNTNAEGDL